MSKAIKWGAAAIAILMLTGTTDVNAAECGVNLAVSFLESAPRDRFVVENRSSLDVKVEQLVLDLAPSKGRLIFDTVSGGAGVEVFQPYRTEESDVVLATEPAVRDGGETITLRFQDLTAKKTYRFSIDVDDRLANSDLGQIRVSGGEMEGASVTFALVTTAGIEQSTGHFDANNSLSLVGGCT